MVGEGDDDIGEDICYGDVVGGLADLIDGIAVLQDIGVNGGEAAVVQPVILAIL